MCTKLLDTFQQLRKKYQEALVDKKPKDCHTCEQVVYVIIYELGRPHCLSIDSQSRDWALPLRENSSTQTANTRRRGQGNINHCAIAGRNLFLGQERLAAGYLWADTLTLHHSQIPRQKSRQGPLGEANTAKFLNKAFFASWSKCVKMIKTTQIARLDGEHFRASFETVASWPES